MNVESTITQQLLVSYNIPLQSITEIFANPIGKQYMHVNLTLFFLQVKHACCACAKVMSACAKVMSNKSA